MLWLDKTDTHEKRWFAWKKNLYFPSSPSPPVRASAPPHWDADSRPPCYQDDSRVQNEPPLPAPVLLLALGPSVPPHWLTGKKVTGSIPQDIFGQPYSKYGCFFAALKASTFNIILPVAFCNFLVNVLDHLFVYKSFWILRNKCIQVSRLLGTRRLLGWTILLKQPACSKCRAFS